MSRISYVRTCANKVEAMHGRSLVSVKVEPRPISRLSSALFYLASIYLPDKNLPALTWVAKNASVESTLIEIALKSPFSSLCEKKPYAV